MEVIINGVKYAPVVGTSNVTDGEINKCLRELTAMRYFNQEHKMMANTWDAINALNPNLAAMSVEDAFNAMHPDYD